MGPYRILDDTLFLKRTYVKETFLDCCPQDIIRFGLGRAGIADYRLSDTMYSKKDVVPVPRMNVAELIQEVGRVWGLEASFYFRSGRRLSMYWRKGRTSFPSTNGTAVTKSRPSGSRGFTRESVSG